MTLVEWLECIFETPFIFSEEVIQVTTLILYLMKPIKEIDCSTCLKEICINLQQIEAKLQNQLYNIRCYEKKVSLYTNEMISHYNTEVEFLSCSIENNKKFNDILSSFKAKYSDESPEVNIKEYILNIVL